MPALLLGSTRMLGLKGSAALTVIVFYLLYKSGIAGLRSGDGKAGWKRKRKSLLWFEWFTRKLDCVKE